MVGIGEVAMAYRSDRNYPNMFFGRPGALVTMPYPRDGIDKPFERRLFDFATGTGQHIVSTMLGGSRLFSLSWKALHVDTFRLMEQYWLGAMGRGPWAFIDPSVTNMLMINQSSATNVYADTRQFSINALGALSSNPTAAQIHRTGATRSLRWLWTSAPGATTPTLSFASPYRSWYGFPVAPNLPYIFSGWAKPDGTIDASITLSFRIQWLGADGTQLSEVTSGDIAATAWRQYSAGGAAPSNAAYARPVVIVTGSTVAAGGSLYLDEFQLEQDTVVNNWAPGAGTRAVEILSLLDPVPFNARFRKGVTMTLRDLTT